MAKRKPIFTLAEMERKLGYSDSSNYADKDTRRFYSDLTPVPASAYERTKKEFEEHEKQQTFQLRKGDETDPENLTWPLTIRYGQDTVIFTQRTRVGFYTFAVDIHYGFGLDLLLLFTKNEALMARTVPKVGCNGEISQRY